MNEFYVYGDFEGTIKALKMVAMIFAQSSYNGLFISVLVLSVVFGALTIYTDRIIGLRSNPMTIAKKVFLAMLLLLVLVVPKGTIYVYDTVKNKTQSVSDIPQGIILFSGIVNRVFIGLKDIIETAGTPIISFDSLGYGTGFQMLNAVPTLYSSLSTASPELQNNISNYIEDCVYMAISRGDITKDNLYKTNNLWGELQTNYNVFYTTIDNNVTTCSNGYNIISSQFNTRINDIMTAFCNSMGYDSSVTEQQQCKNQFSSLFNSFISTGVNNTQIVSSYIAAKSMVDLAANNGDIYAKTLAERNMVGSQLGAGSLAEIYLPYIQSLMSILLVCLFPIVVLLMLIAPSEAFKWYFGMYIWILMWGLIDVIFNTIIQDKAYTIFTEFRNNGGLGLENLLNLNSYSVKILGMYSNMRWMGASLSATMAYGILKFGGHALASISGNIGGSIQSAGASVGKTLSMPGGSANIQKEAYDRLVASAPDIRQMFIPSYANQDITSQAVNIASTRAFGTNLSSSYDNPIDAGTSLGETNAFKQGIAIKTAMYQRGFTNNDANKATEVLAKQVASSSIGQATSQLNEIEQLQDKHGVSFGEAFQMFYGQNAMTKGAGIMADYGLANLFGNKFSDEKGKFNYDKFLDWKLSGSILDGDMAKALKGETGYDVVEGQKITQYGLGKDGDLAFLIANKEGDGVSLVTKGVGQQWTQVGENGLYNGVSVNDEWITRKGSWEEKFNFDNINFTKTFGEKPQWFDSFKNSKISGDMRKVDDNLYILDNAKISSEDGNAQLKTSLNGHLLLRKNNEGEMEIVKGSGLEFWNGPNQKVNIANMGDNGSIIEGTLIDENRVIHKSGNNYDVKEILSENRTIGGYTVLSGAEVTSKSSEDGVAKIQYTGNFTKDGETFTGTLTKQGNSDWIFTQGKGGKNLETTNTHTRSYGPNYTNDSVVNSLMNKDYRILNGLANYDSEKGSNLNTYYSMPIARNIADTFGKYIKHLGEEIGVTEMNAGGSLAMNEGVTANLGFSILSLGTVDFDVSGKTGVTIGDRSIEKETADLWGRYALVLQKAALDFAQDKVDSLGIDNEQTKQAVFTETFNKSFGSLVSSAYENLKQGLESADPALYGKSEGFGAIKAFLENAGFKKNDAEKMTDFLKNELISEFKKPQPSATQSNSNSNFQPSDDNPMP